MAQTLVVRSSGLVPRVLMRRLLSMFSTVLSSLLPDRSPLSVDDGRFVSTESSSSVAISSSDVANVRCSSFPADVDVLLQ